MPVDFGKIVVDGKSVYPFTCLGLRQIRDDRVLLFNFRRSWAIRAILAIFKPSLP
jgi:hypothetical protein